jgi:putative component of membrane protein insertase Oxa1/YidC/SpoIIIJ protein YidD
VVLVWVIRGYQAVISPALPRYGVLRGVILAGWRLLRCNPFSHGGYDPVERQTLFSRRSAEEPLRASQASGGMAPMHMNKA